MKHFCMLLIGLFTLGSNQEDDFSISDSDMVTESNLFKRHLLNWKSLEITSYTYILDYQGMAYLPGKWEIQVVNDEAIHINYAGEGTSNDLPRIDRAPTINTLYKSILACDKGIGCTITKAVFDDKYSLPTYIYQSFTKDGASFTISEFTPQ